LSFSADFSAARTRILTDWITVWDCLTESVKESGIVDRNSVIPVIDDEQIPADWPPQRQFITVRLPSLIWAEGDVMSPTTTGTLSELWVQGQTRISLWQNNQADTLPRADQAIAEVIAGASRGARMLGRLIKLFWERELVNTSDEAVLKRPMKFISIEPPGPGPVGWRAWRGVWELEFAWNLNLEVV
jgi:hypothetical protein